MGGGGGRGGGGLVGGARGARFGGRPGPAGPAPHGAHAPVYRPTATRLVAPGTRTPASVHPGMRAPAHPGARGPARAPGGVRAPRHRPAGVRPSPRHHPHHKHPGRPFRSGRPFGFGWWQPWFPFWGWWADWAPWWWADWGIWLTDLVDVEGTPYVVIWVDECSDEYAQAVADGTFEIPDTYEGYPVLVRYTCGTELTQAAAGLGVAAGDGRIYRHTATVYRDGNPYVIEWFDPQPDPPGKITSLTGYGCCGIGQATPTEPKPTTTPPLPPTPAPVATVLGKPIHVPMMSLGMTALAGGVAGLLFGGFGGALAAAAAGGFGYWMGHQACATAVQTPTTSA